MSRYWRSLTFSSNLMAVSCVALRLVEDARDWRSECRSLMMVDVGGARRNTSGSSLEDLSWFRLIGATIDEGTSAEAMICVLRGCVRVSIEEGAQRWGHVQLLLLDPQSA